MPAGLPLFTLALIATAAEPEDVTELQYSGRLVARDGVLGVLPVKDFDLTCWVTRPDADQIDAAFLVQENGVGIAWPERFGRRTFRLGAATTSGPEVRVLYVHEQRRHLLGLNLPYFAGLERLDVDAAWSDEEFSYSVSDRREVGGRDCWVVQMQPRGRGPSTTLNVATDSGLIVRGTQRLTLGEGEPYELTWELNSETDVDAAEGDATLEVARALVALQEALDRDDETHSATLSAEQLELASTALPGLASAAADTPFSRLVDVITRDVAAQQQRGATLAELAESMLGDPAPEFTLTRLNGDAVPADDLAGKTLVLHFWSYRDAPLEEPYGQVGYLDFLLSRHGDENIAVFGVAVAPEFGDASTAPASIRSVRRLIRFMNLGYEVTVDSDGSVLEAFGDPTQYGAELPLWLVIDGEGKLTHFRTGYYEVDRESGLKELDEAVLESLGK